MASVSPAAEAHAILRAPDLESAERAYLGLMPDLEHVNALARRALGLSRVADAARGYALVDDPGRAAPAGTGDG